ncbi:MAG: hypothetical protein ABIA37_03435 [Candidatus Woesearchaeota archaeon]
MKKNFLTTMKKSVLIFGILLISLILTSCSYKPAAGETALETAAAVRQASIGTQGLELKFLPNYPPTYLYDTTEFVAIAEIWNKGNYDLNPSDCFLELTGYDKNIIRGVYDRQSCVSSGTDLEGKKAYNLQGSSDQIEFKSSNLLLPSGVPDYNPTLNLVACYKYETAANPLICVENSLHQVTSEQKACIVKDVSLAGGQAGPVGISYVDVEMAGDKAIFSINVQNYGTGRVLSPLSSLASCPNTLAYDDFDKIRYSVDLSGGSLINCKPRDGLVRLANNQGKIICQFNIGNTAAYETPLLIRLDYNYMQSLKMPIKIIKTPGYD